MISFALSVVIGILVGWVASVAMRTDSQEEILFDIGIGLVGGVIGPLIIFANSWFESFLAAYLGAFLFLAALAHVRRTQA